jgi:vibriolysin
MTKSALPGGRLSKVVLVFFALTLFFTGPAQTTGGFGGGDVQILGRDALGVPTFVAGNLGALDEVEDPGPAAVRFLQQLAREELLATGGEALQVRRVARDELGYVHVRIDQRIHGLPVVGAELIVHADALTGEVYAVNGRFVPGRGLAVKPALDAVEALELAAAEAEIVGLALDEPELVYALDAAGQARLAWRNRVEYKDGEGLAQIDDLFADAVTGALVARHPRIHYSKSWSTYSANNGTSLPGTLRCTNSQSCGDSILQNIHDHVSETYDYYSTKLGRDSYNGAGITIRSVGHYSSNYSNAFWNSTYLVFGDGNGSQSGPLGNALDIVAHELTHAVTENESGLIYQNESGAINEALSDIFGASTEAWMDGFVSADTWKLGEDTWTPGISGDALRYMNNPTQDGSSKDYYPERYTGTADNGGVHWNSGIANLAFYLMVQGGTHPRGKTSVLVTAIGLTRAEQVFYRAQTNYLTSSSNFLAARNATGQAAQDLYGATYRDRVYTAWCAVGVGSCPGALPAPSFLTVTWEYCRGLNTLSWGAVSGATSYEVQGSHYSNYQYPFLLYSGTATFKAINVTSNTWVRVRACGSAGCSGYRNGNTYARYFSGCY